MSKLNIYGFAQKATLFVVNNLR